MGTEERILSASHKGNGSMKWVVFSAFDQGGGVYSDRVQMFSGAHGKKDAQAHHKQMKACANFWAGGYAAHLDNFWPGTQNRLDLASGVPAWVTYTVTRLRAGFPIVHDWGIHQTARLATRARAGALTKSGHLTSGVGFILDSVDWMDSFDPCEGRRARWRMYEQAKRSNPRTEGEQ